jgi:CubicO group peptidase (beta-lactamase class C family)
MSIINRFLLAACFLITCSPARGDAQGATEGQSPSAGAESSLRTEIDAIRDDFSLPALAGAIVTKDGVQEMAVTGVRKAGTDVPAIDDDLWHIGSCTKAMTATLLGTLVQEGALRWESTLAELFPELRDQMSPPFDQITLRQLLTHRSGLPANGAWHRLESDLPTTAQRHELLKRMSQMKHLDAPGTTFLYSNVGYALAGLAAETVTNRSWEDLMRERLFEPLQMKSAGYGVPGTLGGVDQPWGHQASFWGFGPLKPVQFDNAASLGPAGTVHASLADWGKFIALHLKRENEIVSAEIWDQLHMPSEGEDYALGWTVHDRYWAKDAADKGKALHHSGSNTVNFCVCWLAPERGFAVIAATNSGQPNAMKALDRVASRLITMHLDSQ